MLPMWKCCQSQCCQFSIGARRERAAWKTAFPVIGRAAARPSHAGVGRGVPPSRPRPLTGKAAFQAARPRRAPIENWQHWDWHTLPHSLYPNGWDFGILKTASGRHSPSRGGKLRGSGALAASFGANDIAFGTDPERQRPPNRDILFHPGAT